MNNYVRSLISVFHNDPVIDQQLIRLNAYSRTYSAGIKLGVFKSLFQQFS